MTLWVPFFFRICVSLQYQDAPIHVAARNNQAGVVKDLVETFDVRPGCKNENKMTALHIAAEKGSLDMVKLLVEELEASPMSKDAVWQCFHLR